MEAAPPGYHITRKHMHALNNYSDHQAGEFGCLGATALLLRVAGVFPGIGAGGSHAIKEFASVSPFIRSCFPKVPAASPMKPPHCAVLYFDT
jgi:hypothetical protein